MIPRTARIKMAVLFELLKSGTLAKHTKKVNDHRITKIFNEISQSVDSVEAMEKHSKSIVECWNWWLDGGPEKYLSHPDHTKDTKNFFASMGDTSNLTVPMLLNVVIHWDMAKYCDIAGTAYTDGCRFGDTTAIIKQSHFELIRSTSLYPHISLLPVKAYSHLYRCDEGYLYLLMKSNLIYLERGIERFENIQYSGYTISNPFHDSGKGLVVGKLTRPTGR